MSQRKRFTVEGSGEFPFDMLRFDACFPASMSDSEELERTDARSIELETLSPTSPTPERWRAFRWTVRT
jgi:hypothetical protein